MKTMIAFVTALSFFSCSKNSNTVYSESFNKSDGSNFEYNPTGDYYFCKPLAYNEPINHEKKYPLVIYLHGATNTGINLSNLDYLGYDSNDGKDDQIAKKFQQSHPSFVLVPQTTASVWDSNKLISIIEYFKNQFRIDSYRIYLIGYSMGGSGSYLLANAYYDYNKQLFAGIIRLAGQSQIKVREEIARKTSIWLHIGLDDSELRISVTREAYSFLKKYHSDALESSQIISFSGYTGTTLTLFKNEKETIKKSEYNNVGHGISTFPFTDNNLIDCLFNQKIE